MTGARPPWTRATVGAWCLLASGPCAAGDGVPEWSEPVALFLRADVAATAIVGVSVQITAADLARPVTFDIPTVGRVALGTVFIPPGPRRTITVRALDARGAETHRGSVVTSVRVSPSPGISVVLTPLAGGGARRGAPVGVTLAAFGVSAAPLRDRRLAHGPAGGPPRSLRPQLAQRDFARAL